MTGTVKTQKESKGTKEEKSKEMIEEEVLNDHSKPRDNPKDRREKCRTTLRVEKILKFMVVIRL